MSDSMSITPFVKNRFVSFSLHMLKNYKNAKQTCFILNGQPLAILILLHTREPEMTLVQENLK
jgi:hypothetical protein